MFTEKKSEDKVDRFGMLIVKGGLIFVVLLLIFCFVVTPYVFLCLIRGFELVPVILLTGLIIFVTLVSAYVIVRLNWWMDEEFWGWNILLWMICLGVAVTLFLGVYHLYIGYQMGMITPPVIFLIVLGVIYLSATIYLTKKLPDAAPLGKNIVLLILVIPILYICEHSGFFEEDVPIVIKILGIASMILLFFPLFGPAIVFLKNPTALIEHPWELMNISLILAGIGFLLYLLSAWIARGR